MAFTVSDYHDLVQILERHPEWRAQLRQLLLTDEILGLPQSIRELTEAQKRTEAQVVELVQSVRDLTEGQKQLTEAQKRTEAEVVELVQSVRDLTEAQKRVETRTGRLEGWELEERYRKRAYAYFGRYLRKAHVLDIVELSQIEDAHASGRISDAEWDQLLALDVLVRGMIEQKETYLAIESSTVIDHSDVERAQQRASILRRLGYTVIPVVGGLSILPDAEQLARQLGVAISREGNIVFWPSESASSQKGGRRREL